MTEHAHYHLTSLTQAMLERRAYETCIGLLDRFQAMITHEALMTLYQQFVCSAAKDPNAPQEITLKCLRSIIDWLSTQPKKKQLQAFLSDLEELNAHYYKHAYRIINPA
jgi:hypothetical protein